MRRTKGMCHDVLTFPCLLFFISAVSPVVVHLVLFSFGYAPCCFSVFCLLFFFSYLTDFTIIIQLFCLV